LADASRLIGGEEKGLGRKKRHASDQNVGRRILYPELPVALAETSTKKDFEGKRAVRIKILPENPNSSLNQK